MSDSAGGEGAVPPLPLSEVVGPESLLGVCRTVCSVPNSAVESLWTSTVAEPSLSSRGRRRQPESVE